MDNSMYRYFYQDLMYQTQNPAHSLGEFYVALENDLTTPRYVTREEAIIKGLAVAEKYGHEAKIMRGETEIGVALPDGECIVKAD